MEANMIKEHVLNIYGKIIPKKMNTQGAGVPIRNILGNVLLMIASLF